MQLYFECLPCTMKQITEIAQRLINNKEKQYEIIQECTKSLDGFIYKESCAPILSERFMEIIKHAIGVDDIYLEEKKMFNEEMLSLEDNFRKIIDKSSNPIETSLILSGAANIIDFGINQSIDKEFAKEKILEAFKRNPSNDCYMLMNELNEAKTLMYVGDNCGEAVLDKLVLENIKNKYPNIEIYYAVRGIPVLNDVTIKEAYDIGIDKYAKVISSGSTVPGTIIDKCTLEFKKLYKNSDVKILKGMGNVETAYASENDAYFVFMVKCNFMVNKLQSRLYDVILTKGNPLYRNKAKAIC